MISLQKVWVTNNILHNSISDLIKMYSNTEYVKILTVFLFGGLLVLGSNCQIKMLQLVEECTNSLEYVQKVVVVSIF